MKLSREKTAGDAAGQRSANGNAAAESRETVNEKAAAEGRETVNEKAAAASGQKTVNRITEGVIWKQLLLFFFPILFGTFFQQLYNTVDAIVVGQFVGKEALASVGGPTGNIINLLVGFFVGISSGATVIISQYYGAGRSDMVGYAVHTSAAFALAAGAFLTMTGLIITPFALTAMGTPDDIMEYSVLYMRIYFLGMIPNLIYNIGSAVLRAAGDSRRPLYFLIACCLTNIVLDLLFVVVLKMGVAGAALATIASQAVSAVLVTAVLTHTGEMYRLTLLKIGLDRRMLRRIIRIGLPAGIQSMMYSISNVLIQSSVNSLGTDTVAAWTAYSKVDALFWMTVSAFGISITTFVGQNFGAGRKDRIGKAMNTCLAMAAAATVLLSTVLYSFAAPVLGIFTTDETVLQIGVGIMRFLVPTYITYLIVEIYSGALRGVGDVWIPMVFSMLGVCALRVVWILTAVPVRREMRTIIFSYPLTWTVTSVLLFLYLHLFSRLKSGLPLKHR